MKINRNYIKIFASVFVIVFFYSFTNQRNYKRALLPGVDITYTDDSALYISPDMVNKLLIQNNGNVTGIAKEKLVLSNLEATLNANEMIRDADVYVTINGQVKVTIQQKQPIARVSGAAPFYIDSEGGVMPLSPVFSARVPLITGTVNKKELTDVYALASYIYKDDFLRKNVIGIHQQGKKFDIRFRIDNFIVKLGETGNMETKFNNLKAFYQKALKDNTLNNYSTVNLAFKNQIVCTKRKTHGI